MITHYRNIEITVLQKQIFMTTYWRKQDIISQNNWHY